MKKFLALTTIIFIVATEESSYHMPKTSGEYLDIILSNKRVLVVLCNPRLSILPCEIGEKLIKNLASNDIFHKKKIQLVFANQIYLPKLKEYVPNNAHYAIFYYTNNKIQVYPNYHLVAEQYERHNIFFEHLLDPIFGFIDHHYNRINPKISSIDAFTQLRDEKGIMAAFFGEPNTDFYKKHKELAYSNIDFQFCYIPDFEVGQKIFALLNPEDDFEQNRFAIIRAQSHITEFDPQAIVYLNLNTDFRKLHRFFGYERLPKLYELKKDENIFDRLFKNREKLVLYISDKQANPNDVHEFKKAVVSLPKQYIFVHSTRGDLAYIHLERILLQKKSQLISNRVYLVFPNYSMIKVNAVMKSPINGDKLVDIINGFYLKYGHLFTAIDKNQDVTSGSVSDYENSVFEDL